MNGTTRNVKKCQISCSKTDMIVSIFVPGAANAQYSFSVSFLQPKLIVSILILLSGIALSTIILYHVHCLTFFFCCFICHYLSYSCSNSAIPAWVMFTNNCALLGLMSHNIHVYSITYNNYYNILLCMILVATSQAVGLPHSQL